MKKGLSPMVASGLILAITFAALHLAGFREHVSVLSGTVPSTGGASSAVFGALYVLSWLAFVILTPILLLAFGIRTVLLRLFHGPRAQPGPGPDPS